MPSTLLFSQSGGIGLVSGGIFSGTPHPIGGVQLLLAAGAPSLIYVGVTNLSGDVVTGASGGVFTSGGMADGMELGIGKNYFIPRSRLVSGIESIRLLVPAAASGGRCFWEYF